MDDIYAHRNSSLFLQDHELIPAIESGDVMTVVSLLNSGAGVQTEDEVYIFFLFSILILTLPIIICLINPCLCACAVRVCCVCVCLLIASSKFQASNVDVYVL